MKFAVAAVITLSVAASATAQNPVEYRFDEVRRKVVVTNANSERQASTGQRATGGEKVATGWFSYALIAAERYRAKFELFSSTDVTLAENEPGVILSLERGRLRAVFDKLTGNEPRVVKTPGALLAVRGTQYDVSVDKNGDTQLDVLEGTVEVRSALRPEPMFVHAGEAVRYGRQEAPHSAPPRRERGPADRQGQGQHGDPDRGDPRGGMRPEGPQQPGTGTPRGMPGGQMPPPSPRGPGHG